MVAPNDIALLNCRYVNLAATLADKLQNGVDCDEQAIRKEVALVKTYLFAAKNEDVCKVSPRLIDNLIRYCNNLRNN